MPIKYDKKHLRLCRDYIRYLIMPFVQLEPSSDQKRIEINFSAKSRGLLTGLQKMDFLDKECFITLNHIVGNTFRIVLTEHLQYFE
jgi:hypothetical protein